MVVPKVCPKCGREIHPKVWYEDYYIVEYFLGVYVAMVSIGHTEPILTQMIKEC